MTDARNELPQADSATPENPVRMSKDVMLFDWQNEAVRKWMVGDDAGPHRGTLEIFTGGGKSLIAMAAFAKVSEMSPTTRLVVVVPSEALARQWVGILERQTTLKKTDIGLLGAGKKDTFSGKRAVVAVLNSAARKLPEIAANVSPLMLVIDECHRAGAPSYSKVLGTRAEYRLGLSATPARDEVDDDGLPLDYDQQLVGQKIGAVVFKFGLREAREIGWLPNYTVHHHGVNLHDAEKLEYERISRKVTDTADRLSLTGTQTSQAWSSAKKDGQIGLAAQAYISALTSRKDFLYRVTERGRVAVRLVEELMQRTPLPKVLLFHERVAEVESLFAELQTTIPTVKIGLEHSVLPVKARKLVLDDFRSGKLNILVSVKSLVEGIDVPDADVGISVASSSSVRQRIQTLGRVLRRRFDGEEKQAEMHVLYVHDTVDESIYGKEDWSDLTGPDSNRYWLWPTDPEAPPIPQEEPPQKPKPTEEAEWKRFGECVPADPAIWLGEIPGSEFSVDTRGNVTTSSGAAVENPQGVTEMVRRVRGRPGGRFRITPNFNLVIVFGEAGKGMAPYLAGKLTERFQIQKEVMDNQADFDAESLSPGDKYSGPLDKSNGTFKFRQKKGGVIEQRVKDVFQFANTDVVENRLSENGEKCLKAWKSVSEQGFAFFVNEIDHAWYRQDGEARFLAVVPGGFLWPDSEPPNTRPGG